MKALLLPASVLLAFLVSSCGSEPAAGHVFEAIQGNNRNVGGAYLVRNREQVVIRGEGMIRTLQDIGDVVVEVDVEQGRHAVAKGLFTYLVYARARGV